MKRFKEWFTLKPKLDSSSSTPPMVHERDLWWVSIGENVGSEISGKSNPFSRPGVILKKLSRGFYLIAPTTSKEHSGSWYVRIMQNGRESYVCLHQIRTIDFRRLSSQLGRIDESDFKRIKDGFDLLYK